jgi:hypothetical protein
MVILFITIAIALTCLVLMFIIIKSENKKGKEMQIFNDNLDKFTKEQENLIHNLNKSKSEKKN